MPPMTISVIAYKGGVGKTTLSALLGIGLSILRGKKVLLIDLDPQANLTEVYTTYPVIREMFISYNTEHVFSLDFFTDPKNKEPLIIKINNTFEKLYLLPSHPKYMRIYEYYNIRPTDASTARIRLGELAERYGFDYIILDLPPQMYQLVTPIACISTDFFVSPIIKGAFSDNVIYYMLETFYNTALNYRKIGEYGELNKFLGVILMKFSTKETRSITKTKERIENKINELLKKRIEFKESPMYEKPVFDTIIYYNPALTRLRGVIFGRTPYIVKVFRRKFKGKIYNKLIHNTEKLIEEFENRVQALA